MPGDLYHFADRARDSVALRLNGTPITAPRVKGFARIDREWHEGDVVELVLPMPVRRVLANAQVQDDRGRVALERGPIVYAAEWPDNGGHALDLVVPDEATFSSEFRPTLLNGVVVITGAVQAVTRTSPTSLPEMQPHQLVAIPYYAWANRGMGEMAVWLPRDASRARPTPVVPPDPIASVTSSGGVEKKWTGYNDQNDDLAAVYDGVTPISSADESNLYFRMRPPVGHPAWIEYRFKSPTTVASTEVYFADDRRFCKLPASWRLVYLDGDTWKPVTPTTGYLVAKDQFNRAAFAPVTTRAVRIEIEPATRHYKSGEIGPPDAMFLSTDADWREAGVIEWRVH